MIKIFRNRKIAIGLVLVVPLLAIIALGPLIAPYDYTAQGVGGVLEGPSWQHWFGTDLYGRDELSRLLAGGITAIEVVCVVGVGTLIGGVALGATAGFFGGIIDSVIMRIVDIMLAFPWILVTLGMVAVLGPGLRTVLIALILVYIPQLARIARNTVRSVLTADYVAAARAHGESSWSILTRYVLRNAAFPIMVLLTSMLAFSVLNESGISFLGFGVQSPATSWGLELANGTAYAGAAPHLVIFPGLIIAWLVIGLNLLGDGLTDIVNVGE